ncbi:acetamidase/formamidase family protein [Falsiroseomonas oryzae]|uniref:acetamidase/formamidase family protein n=1 Tax=Falsiroseomonas oryzae TaxID=2766473 RepID=UPI0022EB757B|nr:acetamidase/formamidase family protein [Roseomonas sp. MO-31]
MHSLPATPDTVRFGMFDARFPPVLTIRSGEAVEMQCVSGMPEFMPPPGSGFATPPALAAIHAAQLPRLGPHIVTGPVAVEGAEPGDMLRVDIEAIEPGAEWGYCGHHPLFGMLPEEFPGRRILFIPVDRAARSATVPIAGGVTLPLRPFFGIMAVAPPPEWGLQSTREPRAHGGNMDNKELVAGSTLFLPVHAPGALFSAGDGHGVQGDGEVCINALELCLTGRFRLTLAKGGGRDDPALRFPRAETPTHFISMGMDADLDLAMKQALREMIGFLVARAGITPADAYQLCSLAVDFRVTQAVNGEKGVHGMLRKDLIV